MGKSLRVTWLLLILLGCTTPRGLDVNVRADLIEAKLLELGESRLVAGAATPATTHAFELSKQKSNGDWQWGLQQVAIVHVIAGNINSGIALYKVGFVAGQPTIVCKTEMGSKVFDVIWEQWPDGKKRSGSPAPSRLKFLQ